MHVYVTSRHLLVIKSAYSLQTVCRLMYVITCFTLVFKSPSLTVYELHVYLQRSSVASCVHSSAALPFLLANSSYDSTNDQIINMRPF